MTVSLVYTSETTTLQAIRAGLRKKPLAPEFRLAEQGRAADGRVLWGAFLARGNFQFAA